MSRLIKKTIFDQDYYKPKTAAWVEGPEGSQNGLIISCTDDTLTLAVIMDDYVQDEEGNEELSPIPATLSISVEDVESGEYSISRFINQKPVDYKQVYDAYESVSKELANEEVIVAGYNGDFNEEESEERHKDRLQSFRKLLNPADSEE